MKLPKALRRLLASSAASGWLSRSRISRVGAVGVDKVHHVPLAGKHRAALPRGAAAAMACAISGVEFGIIRSRGKEGRHGEGAEPAGEQPVAGGKNLVGARIGNGVHGGQPVAQLLVQWRLAWPQPAADRLFDVAASSALQICSWVSIRGAFGVLAIRQLCQS